MASKIRRIGVEAHVNSIQRRTRKYGASMGLHNLTKTGGAAVAGHGRWNRKVTAGGLKMLRKHGLSK